MTSVQEYIDLPVSPASVWSVVGAPGAICDWHPGIVSSPLIDGVRTCTLRGGGEINEAIVEHSDERRFYIYAVVGDLFGMVNYRSRIQVDDLDGGARVIWTGDFDVSEISQGDVLAETVAATYREGLEALPKVITSR
jgi:hypothetical protein